ncbi:hypothetical protein BDY21DRAFT_361719 [Lineolata rhizophorae]|uniref:PH domain-containing protein n=1 Tax=Lineolata rhizophorae TaxID=578093 RepID=A0A6A6P733_9PEZI|nr:hypothetical protein BDY21DRAFT_361719 [Lineolata rhizophorae]
MNPSSSSHSLEQPARESPTTRPRARSDSRTSSRPPSMLQTYQPPVMDVARDTIPELLPIFSFLNSHSNKLYQEGYFLKLHDLDTRGRPSADRTWTECFAQLVGTVLSLWDASQLDVAGEDGEVVPSFINLADASIKMIESLPMNGQGGQTLQNVLSISTAANNRYLLHFNSLNSLTQWTAGIRLAMYEHSTLQEAYTGSLIAGKGKTLNNINMIMERARVKHEDWARVRFGAGTPWRRCWCVISPPDEKEFQKLQKALKKGSAYNRRSPVLKGDLKFYDTKKITKKTNPIATVSDAYSAYAIYPQSKPLVDQSTLVKIEGVVTIHSQPESTTEGFVFVMPEVHPAVSGFEMMLRFLFPIFDVFNLYGRPNRLIADPLDPRGLMFAMPTDRRYGYLELFDVAGLIHSEGSQNWTERQWRKQMKDLTAKRMQSAPSRDNSRNSRMGSRRYTINRSSLPPSRSGVLRFEDGGGSTRSQPSTRHGSPTRANEPSGPKRVDSAPPNAANVGGLGHRRSVSEANAAPAYRHFQADAPSRLAYGTNVDDRPPTPPQHRELPERPTMDSPGYETASEGREYASPESGLGRGDSDENIPAITSTGPALTPVAEPPNFLHAPSQRPPNQPYQAPELRRANSAIDAATLRQMADANHAMNPNSLAAAGAAAAWRASPDGTRSDMRQNSDERMDMGQRGVFADPRDRGAPADDYVHHQGMVNSRAQLPAQRGRLPTIPASPYIPQTESPTSGTVFEPAAPPVPEHGTPMGLYMPSQSAPPQQNPNAPTDFAARPIPQRSATSFSIHRKPVPGRGSVELARADSRSNSSVGSLRNHVLDQNAIDQIGTAPLGRTATQATGSSHYSEPEDLSATPDYASTKSAESKHSVERPRHGQLKTVGHSAEEPKDIVVGDIHYGHRTEREAKSDLPSVDFGPTYALSPDRPRPGTSGTITQGSHSRDRSGGATPRMTESNRQSYFGATSPPGHQRNSSRSPGTPAEDAFGRADHRSMAWQPGMTSSPGRAQTPNRLTAEEWVQQRAAAASQPHLVPRTSPTQPQNRSKSAGNTPPTSRNPSGDWSQLQAQPNRTPPLESRRSPRPHSRGPSQTLLSDSEDYSKRLSAREQEYVARATGQPFLNMARPEESARPPSASGLVGAIEAREKEKQDFKDAHSSSRVVQEAIRQRQQQAYAQAQANSMAQSLQYMGLDSSQQQQQQFMMQQQAQGPMQQPYGQPAFNQSQQGFYPQHGFPGANAQGWGGQGSPMGGMSYGGFPQQQQQPQQAPRQAYGASFFAQHPEQNQGQGVYPRQQGGGRR